jgi:antitoxin component YwqK of YwqJK toxin-antitoxin module
MDSLPIEIIEIIFLFVNPKDYTNFILSYNATLCFWRNKKIREKYKGQYLRVVREDFIDGSGMYTIKTVRVDNGKNHGKYVEYYKNDQICIDTTYRNDKIHGKYVEYHKDGRLWMDITYKSGRICGKYIEYYKDGQIMDRYNISNYLQYIANAWKMH